MPEIMANGDGTTSDETVSPPRKISEEDRLSVENLYLRVENLALQRKVLQQDLAKADGMIKEVQQKLVDKSKEFAQKYGIVLGRDQIAPDGTILTTGETPRN